MFTLAALLSGCRAPSTQIDIPDRNYAVAASQWHTATILVDCRRKLNQQETELCSEQLRKSVSGQINHSALNANSIAKLSSEMAPEKLIDNDKLKLNEMAELCRMLGCRSGVFCFLTELDKNKAKVLLVWIDADKRKLLGTLRREVKAVDIETPRSRECFNLPEYASSTSAAMLYNSLKRPNRHIKVEL